MKRMHVSKVPIFEPMDLKSIGHQSRLWDARHKWAASWQNQQNGMCAQRRLRSAWAYAQSDQSLLSAWRKLGSLATYWALSEDGWKTKADDQADLSLRWAQSHFVGFVMRRFKCFKVLHLGSFLCSFLDLQRCVCVNSRLTSLSKFFQSYHDGVWLRHGAQCSLL